MLGCKVFLTYKRKRLAGNSHAHGNECRNLYDRLINKTPSKDEAGSSSMQTLGRLEPEKDVKDDDIAGPSTTNNGLENDPCHPNMDSSEPSKKRKVSFEAHEDPTVPKTSSMDISATLSDDKPDVLCRDSSELTKFKAPLMTFVRRCKRKRITEVGDTGSKSPLDGTKCSTVTQCDGTFSHEAGSNLKPREEVHDTGDVVPHAENKIPEVVPSCPYTEPAPDFEVLTFEGENPVVNLNSSSDGLNKDEQVLDQNDARQDLSACCLGISLNNGVGKKPAKENSNKEESLAILNNGPKEIAEASHPFLDLSITPTDSSGTVECNAYLESNSRRRSGHAIRETLLGSMDSTSRSHAAVLRQRYPPEMLFGESSSTQNSHLCPDSWAYAKGPVIVADFKDNDKPSLVPLDFLSKDSCLQLFAEERAKESTRPVYTRLEAANSVPKRNSPPFLGLGLPTRPKTTRFACDSSFTTFPFSNPVEETQESFEPSSSQLTSLLRHKSVLDGIVNQARGLSERDLSHTKLKLYNSSWTEEELDSLWVGVRRYGRKNWNAMIRDPRLRFSSWRVARDLAEQWEEEQAKLLQGASAGNCREITAEETRLSLGDVYNSRRERKVSRRARFKSKAVPKHNPPPMSAHGSLPHWLREAVFSPPASWRQPPLAPAIAHPHMMPPNWPCFDQYDLSSRQQRNETNHAGCGFQRNGVESISAGGHHPDPPSGTSIAADVIVIESDASSEETISDDHNARQ